MAYGTRYTTSIQSLDGQTYTVKILKKDYADTPVALPSLGKPAMRVRWGQQQADIYEAIRPSIADVMLFDKLRVVQNEIFNADEEAFRLQIEKGAKVYWIGKILTDIFDTSLNVRPESSKVSAIDGLGQLEGLGYDHTTRVSVVQAIADILKKIGLDLNIRFASNWFTPDILSGEDPLAKLNVERKALWGEDDAEVSCKAALKQILERFGLQLHQSQGVWWVIQRELLGAAVFTYFEYDKDGVFVSSQTGYNPAVTFTDTNQYTKRRAGGRGQYKAAYKTTTVLYYPKADSGSIITNGSFEDWTLNTPDGWTESLPGGLFNRESIAKEGTFSCSVPAIYNPDPNVVPPHYIQRLGGLVSGGLNRLRISINAQLKKNPNNLTVPENFNPRKTYFSIKYGDYWLKRDVNGVVSWVHQSSMSPYDDYILFNNKGVEFSGFWQTDAFDTPVVPTAIGQLTVRLYQVVEFEFTTGQESTTAAFTGVVWDDVKVEVLVASETVNVVEGVKTITTSIVLPNTVNRDQVEFSIGDGPSSLTPSRLTIGGSTTLTGNWKRGAYAGENPTGISIDSLLAQTWMRAEKTPLAIHQATYTARPSAGAVIEAHNVLVIGSKRYAFTSLDRDLVAGRSIGEWIEIKAEDSDLITAVTAVTKESGINRERRSTYFGDGTEVRSETFANGFAGSGWAIIKEGGKWYLVIDGIRVRETLSAKEILFQQVRATNGSLFVATTGKVKNFTNVSP